MAIFPWTEIESFHNVLKYTGVAPEILGGNSSVTYRAKVKLHGNNAGIQVHNNSQVIAQSRTVELGPGNDLCGFAAWVSETAPFIRGHINDRDIILYGEWCGKGIQGGVAINNIDKKVFALFAARPMDPEDDRLIVEPFELRVLTAGLKDVYVLPWYNEPIVVDWSANAETLGTKTALINEWVSTVEANDPWVESTFGVKGTGEGLVFYPVSHPGYKNYCNLVFKAKGSLHKMIKATKPAQINAAVAADANHFVDMVLTDARLIQGAVIVSGEGQIDPKNTGKFITWILSDVLKECADELMASRLSFTKDIQKLLSDKARIWWLNKARQ